MSTDNDNKGLGASAAAQHRATHEPNPQAVSALRVGIADATLRIANGPWRVEGEWMEGDPHLARAPHWVRPLTFAGYRWQGWAAFLRGNQVAAGRWGDELWQNPNGGFGCTEYPHGWSVEAAVEKGRAAQAMSTGTAKTPKAVEGRSPASAVPKGCAQPTDIQP